MTTKEAAQCFRQAGATVPKELAAPSLPNKFNAKRKTVDGHTFDSTGEAEAYRVLKLWERSGSIRFLELQPQFKLQEKAKGRRAIWYRADFSFFDVIQNRWRVVDYKGFKTPVFRLKMKLMAEKFPEVNIELWDRAKVREYSKV